MPSKKKKKSGRGKARKVGSSSSKKKQGSLLLDAQMERLNIDGGGDGDLVQEASLLEEAIKLAAAEKEALESKAGEKEESTEMEKTLIHPWQCYHGYVLSEDHSIFVDFAKTFSQAFFSGNNRNARDCIEANLEAAGEKYPGVWCDSSKLKMVRSFFLSFATQNVLEGKFDDGTRFDIFAACLIEDYIAHNFFHKLKPQADRVLKVQELMNIQL